MAKAKRWPRSLRASILQQVALMFKRKTRLMKETLDEFEKRMEKIIQEILEEEQKKNKKLVEELKKYGDQLKINV